jgi:hypothetical protein
MVIINLTYSNVLPQLVRCFKESNSIKKVSCYKLFFVEYDKIVTVLDGKKVCSI